MTNAKLLKNNINNENNELFNDLVHEYDRRLEEQVKLAKADMLNELESQIKVSKNGDFCVRMISHAERKMLLQIRSFRFICKMYCSLT